jgi:hypothetical protein
MRPAYALGGIASYQLPPAPPIFGSLATPPDNGVSASSLTSGQVQLTGARTALVGTAGTAAALWGTAQSFMMLLDMDRELVDGRNIRMSAMGTLAGGTPSTNTTVRAASLQYVSLTSGTAAERGKFYFYIRGESAASAAWRMEVAIPASARGPYIALAWNDTTNGFLSIYDIPTATWYDSAAVAKPAGWGGCSQITNEIVLGGSGGYTFPGDNSVNRQNSSQWIGSFRDAVFAAVAMTKSNAIAILNGANVATELGGSSNVRLHAPCAVDGAFSATKSGTNSGSVTVTQQGTLFAGPSLKRQGATDYVTIDRRATVFGTNPGTTSATAQLSGTHGGTATGDLQIRQVGESGTVYRNWHTVTNTGSMGAWACVTTLNEASERCDIQARFSGAPTLIANSGVRHWVKPVIVFHGQSEVVLSMFNADSSRALGTAPVVPLTLNSTAGRVSFGALSFLNAYCRIQSAELPGYLGAEAVAIANMVGGNRPVHIVVNAISGTSMLALMNDADSSRQWQDTLDRCGSIANRDATGAIPVHTHIIGGWEAFYSGIDGVMKGAYRPFLTGVASNDIALADIDHWLFNGEFSDDAEVIIMPCNRASAVNAAGATATDTSTEANQRDQMRNWAHILGYTVGPEQKTHKLQGENAASGALVAATHPEDDDFEGDIEMAVQNAEGIRMALGLGTYPGSVFFETITAGTAANKVKLRLGLPRLQPGLGLAEDATGYSTAPQSGSYTYALHTKIASGDAGAGFEARIRPSGGSFGAWSKANVVSGVITDAATGEVELTLSASLGTGDTVEIEYHPGVPGAYATGTLTQAAWRAGSLFFTGTAPASIVSITDVQAIGFAVAGSNQALSFTA